MAHIPCFLCGQDLTVRIDKNRKSYFICDDCGVQAFVRKQKGITRLDKLLRDLRTRDFQFAKHKQSFFQICGILNEIDDLQQQIKKLEDKIGFFSSDPTTERAIEALKSRITALLSVLEKHAEDVQQIAQ